MYWSACFPSPGARFRSRVVSYFRRPCFCWPYKKTKIRQDALGLLPVKRIDHTAVDLRDRSRLGPGHLNTLEELRKEAITEQVRLRRAQRRLNRESEVVRVPLAVIPHGYVDDVIQSDIATHGSRSSSSTSTREDPDES